MSEFVLFLAVFPTTLGAAYLAQRGLLSLLFRALQRPQ